jgi:hypothetical protein
MEGQRKEARNLNCFGEGRREKENKRKKGILERKKLVAPMK